MPQTPTSSTVETSFETEGREAVRAFHNIITPDPDAMVNYTLMFLVGYERALNWAHTGPDHFLDAYGHMELAAANGASEKALDAESYRLRCEWAEAYDRKQASK